MATVGINGFGRIGRMCLRVCLENDIEIKHINDPYIQPDYMIYLFKYDSTHGCFKDCVTCEEGSLVINEKRITTSHEKDPASVPWREAGVQFVIEATGVFTESEKAKMHIEGGASHVVITAPSDAPNFVFGANHRLYDPERHGNCISAASCTTNCAAPIVRLMHDNFGVKEAMITSIHALIPNQKVVDSPTGKLWRYGRGAVQNIIPSSTGASKCMGKIIPELKGKISAIAFHVPVSNVSLCDITFRISQPTTLEQVKRVMKAASETELKGVLGYTQDDCVSSDFNHTPFSCIFDARAAIPHTSTFVKVVAWYDNEYGYANRVVDLVMYMNDVITGKMTPLAEYPRMTNFDPSCSEKSFRMDKIEDTTIKGESELTSVKRDSESTSAKRVSVAE
ncbi:hypothetical protein QAD02_001163 [Eretmocerus hayati]|uniref:Uncharacterized protein n=1 Tax=Eretmocerus hayati TaxID=131215 RepID=A0ACC2NHW5_9HYME|nr:hypothetical protein QAD02_001163 [Eretmocerus hayati]